MTLDQTILEEPSVLQASAMEGSRTTLDESVMPPPSSHRGQKRKVQDTEPALPVSVPAFRIYSDFPRFIITQNIFFFLHDLVVGSYDIVITKHVTIPIHDSVWFKLLDLQFNIATIFFYLGWKDHFIFTTYSFYKS